MINSKRRENHRHLSQTGMVPVRVVDDASRMRHQGKGECKTRNRARRHSLFRLRRERHHRSGSNLSCISRNSVQHGGEAPAAARLSPALHLCSPSWGRLTPSCLALLARNVTCSSCTATRFSRSCGDYCGPPKPSQQIRTSCARWLLASHFLAPLNAGGPDVSAKSLAMVAWACFASRGIWASAFTLVPVNHPSQESP